MILLTTLKMANLTMMPTEPESKDEAFDTKPDGLPEDLELKRLHTTIRNWSTLPNPYLSLF
jgi:hypothetical protein